MLSFFRKKHSESDVVTKIGAVRSIVVEADVSHYFLKIIKENKFVYIASKHFPIFFLLISGSL